MTTTEVSKLLNLSMSRVQQLAAGGMPHTRNSNNGYVFDEAKVLEWRAARKAMIADPLAWKRHLNKKGAERRARLQKGEN